MASWLSLRCHYRIVQQLQLEVGAFAGLSRVRPGSRITVEAGGTDQLYRVSQAFSVAKSSFAAAAIYGPGKRPALVLITCGGRFDERTGHYEDNVVVLAQEA